MEYARIEAMLQDTMIINPSPKIKAKREQTGAYNTLCAIRRAVYHLENDNLEVIVMKTMCMMNIVYGFCAPYNQLQRVY